MTRRDVDGRLDATRLVRRAAELSAGPFAVQLRPQDAGWKYSGLRVLRLPAGGTLALPTAGVETGVLPLSGSAELAVGGEQYALRGRTSPFDGPSDFLYVPLGADAVLSTAEGGEFALVTAVADRVLPAVYVAADEVPVLERGSGQCARVVRNFCAPDVVEADRLIAVEVVTPGGNWSSYPPHKHDAESEHEVPLEEIYYFRTASPGAFALHSVYRRDDQGQLDENTVMVEDGDLVVVPDSYHGPSVAGPGYDLYYLNVLAGPSQNRALAVCDDASHAWIRDAWTSAPAIRLSGQPTALEYPATESAASGARQGDTA